MLELAQITRKEHCNKTQQKVLNDQKSYIFKQLMVKVPIIKKLVNCFVSKSIDHFL